MIRPGAGISDWRERVGGFSASALLHAVLFAAISAGIATPARLTKGKQVIQYVDLVTPGSLPPGTARKGAERPAPAGGDASAAKARRPAPVYPLAAPAARKEAALPAEVARPVPPVRAVPALLPPASATALPAAMHSPAAGSGAGSLPHSAAAGAEARGGERVGRSGGAGTGVGAAVGTAAGTGPGTGGGAGMERARDAFAAYRSRLVSLIEAQKKYPVAARRMRQEGSCQRRLVLSRSGALKEVESLTSCGNEYLDDAATGAIRAVPGYPPFPAELKGSEASFEVTITFGLSKR